MTTFNCWLRAFAALVLVSGAAGCAVDFPKDAPYTCEVEDDCGGEGYVCTSLPNNGPKYCCLPEPEEKCNNVDDDCDGQIDEGIDRGSDPANCGTCGNACTAEQACVEGRCQLRAGIH